MASDTTASMDKLTCPDYVDFGKCQDRFGRFSWSKNDSNYMDKQRKGFEKDEKRFSTSTKSYNGRVRVQIIYAIEESTRLCHKNLWRRVKFVSDTFTKKTKHTDKQLKLAHTIVDVLDFPNRKMCVTM